MHVQLEDARTTTWSDIVSVYDEDGALIATTLYHSEPGNDVPIQQIDIAPGEEFSGSDVPMLDTSIIYGREYQMAYTPIDMQSNPGMEVLAVGMSRDYVITGWGDQRFFIMLLTLLFMIIIISFGFFIARSL